MLTYPLLKLRMGPDAFQEERVVSLPKKVLIFPFVVVQVVFDMRLSCHVWRKGRCSLPSSHAWGQGDQLKMADELNVSWHGSL